MFAEGIHCRSTDVFCFLNFSLHPTLLVKSEVADKKQFELGIRILFPPCTQVEKVDLSNFAPLARLFSETTENVNLGALESAVTALQSPFDLCESSV